MNIFVKKRCLAVSGVFQRLMAEGAARARGGKLGSAKKLEPEDIERIYAAARGLIRQKRRQFYD